MRFTRAVLVVALVAAATSCSEDRGDDDRAGRQDSAHTWRQLPDGPLTPRTHAAVVSVGQRVLVVGGWELLCPPSAGCATPADPLLDDGAVYDRASDSWSAVAPPPFGLRRQEYAAAALDGSAYLLSTCADGPRCAAQPRLLSYDLGADHWTDHGSLPGPGRDRRLATTGTTLLVYSASDERGEVADLVFDPESSRWTELPDDPLSQVFDRFIVPVDAELVLTGSSQAALEADAEATTVAARLNPSTGEWAGLPDAPGAGYQLLPSDRGPLLNGHFIDSPGWVLDTDTWTWTELPVRAGAHRDLSGVLDRERATYDIPNSVGSMTSTMQLVVYDSVTESLVTIPPLSGRDHVYDDSSTALGRDLFVFGGQRWTGEGPDGDGELVDDAWLWTAPSS